MYRRQNFYKVILQDPLHNSKPISAFGSFEHQNQRQLVRAPVRNKSMLSVFFVKQKTPKLKPRPV